MKHYYDISQSVCEEGFQNPAFKDGSIEICMTHEREGWHAENLCTALHCGTHLDAPLHLLPGGKPLEEYPIERYFGSALMLDMRHKGADGEISEADLYAYGGLIKEGCNVFLCTAWSKKRRSGTKDEYLHKAPWLSGQAARYLADKKINCVATEHFSIGGSKHATEPHNVLLEAEILILEGFVFHEILLERHDWQVVMLPLKLPGCSGAPARVVAYY